MRLLIVDNDAHIQKSLSIMFSQESDIAISGCASNGIEAIEMCRAQQPDVVLMDIQMPVMDGITATRLIKKEHPHVKVVIFATFGIKSDIQQAFEAGADGYMLKTNAIKKIVGKLYAFTGKNIL